MEFRESSAISSDSLDRFARVESNEQRFDGEGDSIFLFFFIERVKERREELDAWAAAIFEH